MSTAAYPVLVDEDIPENPPLEAATAAPTDDGVVLEMQERGHRLALALPITSWPCVIGRAATSSLVLTEPSIAPAHVRLHRTAPNAFEIEVLDTTNGVWLNNRHYRAGERFAWQPGSKLVLGRGVQLSLRSASQALPATQPWQPGSRWQGLMTTAALLALATSLTATTWLGATESGALARELPTALLTALGGLLVWTLFWSLMGKLFTGSTAFWRHMCIAAVGSVATVLVSALLAWMGFAFSLPVLTRFQSIVSMVLLALIVWYHLRTATLVSARTLSITVAALLLIAAGTRLGLQWQNSKQLGDTLYMSTILPPAWRIAPAVPVQQFMQRSSSLQKQLEQRVKKADADDEGGSDEDNGLD